MQQLNFKFNIGDKVEILELQMKGKVTAIFIDNGGPTYKVKYFDKAERREVYFDDDEIRLSTEQTKTPISFKEIDV